ncbi:MAG: hypothetical protein B7733_09455 [Myxococcales bacterium FL481]|nr:MAG: hypothetical protein B7733_09455 [Myxococcales bacterium FL481]
MAKSRFEAFRVDKNGPDPAPSNRMSSGKTSGNSSRKNPRKKTLKNDGSSSGRKKALVQVATERLTLYLKPEAASQFKQLKARIGCSGPELAAEAMNLLFAKHHVDTVA